MIGILFLIAKILVVFIGSSICFILLFLALEGAKTSKEDWQKTKNGLVINTKTNCWESVKIRVIPENILPPEEIYIHL